MNFVTLPVLAAYVGYQRHCCSLLLRLFDFFLPALHQLLFRMLRFADIFTDPGHVQALKTVVGLADVAAEQLTDLAGGCRAVCFDELHNGFLLRF